MYVNRQYQNSSIKLRQKIHNKCSLHRGQRQNSTQRYSRTPIRSVSTPLVGRKIRIFDVGVTEDQENDVFKENKEHFAEAYFELVQLNNIRFT